MEADFERDFLETSDKIIKAKLHWSFLKPNTFKLLKFTDKYHYPCEFENVW